MNSEHLQFLDEVYGDDGIDYITEEDRVYLNQIKDETVLCLKNEPEVLSNFNRGKLYFETLGSMSNSRPLCVFDDMPRVGKHRKTIEYFNNSWLQCTVAACIHEPVYMNGNSVLFLKLINPGDVTDYRKDTLTFPQGHVQYIASNFTFKETLDYNMKKEIREELANNLEFNGIDYTIKIEEILSIVDQSNIYPIYINKPGSSRKHACFLYDIDISKASIMSFLTNGIISNERSKHEVIYLYKKDFINGHYMKNICPWVMAGFHAIPFFKYWIDVDTRTEYLKLH